MASRRSLALVAMLAASAAPLSIRAAQGVTASGSAHAELVMINGNIITMGSGPARASTIAIRDGLVVGIGEGTSADGFIGADTRIIDLGGATVIPGLVDAHSHFFEEGMRQGVGAGIQDTEILSNGITTTAEFHTDSQMVAQMQAYADAGELKVRTSLYLTYTDACGVLHGDWWKAHPPTREPGELLRIGGIKVFADGGSCNAPAVTYTYPDGGSGDLYFGVDEMESIILEIEGAGHQAAVHALGDRAVDTVLAAMERVIGDGDNPLRHRVEHSAVVGPDRYGRHQDAGVVATLFGAFRTCFMTDANNDFRYRTPEALLSWEWPWRQLLETNPETTFAWHVDYPALPASLGANLAGFVTRVEGSCQPTSDMAVGTIAAEEALRLMTLGSAYALDRDDEVGSLEFGKFADLAVISQDPLAVDPLALESTEVLMTMVGGQVAFCREGHSGICQPADPQPAAEPNGGSPTECQPMSENHARGGAVSASASLGDRPPGHAVDGDVDTGWGAGAGPEQWIEIDLGQERRLTCVRLLVDQYPAGRTVHRVNGGAHSDPGAELGVIDSTTDYGEWIELPGSWSVRYLRITTLQSPSWVSWLEVEAY